MYFPFQLLRTDSFETLKLTRLSLARTQVLFEHHVAAKMTRCQLANGEGWDEEQACP